MLKEQHLIAVALCLSGLAYPLASIAQGMDCERSPSILEETWSEGALPPVRTIGNIRFISGGIGADEAAAMRAQRQQYPLAITFAERGAVRNGFVASVYATISRPDGSTVLCVVTRGPYLYVDLPAGTYRITANAPGRAELAQKLTVVTGRHVDLAMVWPAKPEVQHPLVEPQPPVILRMPAAPVAAPATPPPAAEAIPAPMPPGETPAPPAEPEPPLPAVTEDPAAVLPPAPPPSP